MKGLISASLLAALTLTVVHTASAQTSPSLYTEQGARSEAPQGDSKDDDRKKKKQKEPQKQTPQSAQSAASSGPDHPSSSSSGSGSSATATAGSTGAAGATNAVLAGAGLPLGDPLAAASASGAAGGSPSAPTNPVATPGAGGGGAGGAPAGAGANAAAAGSGATAGGGGAVAAAPPAAGGAPLVAADTGEESKVLAEPAPEGVPSKQPWYISRRVLITGSVTLAVGLASGILGAVAIVRRNDFQSVNGKAGFTETELSDKHDTARLFGNLSTATGAAALVGVGLTTWFILADREEQTEKQTAEPKSSAALTPWFSQTGAGLVYRRAL